MPLKVNRAPVLTLWATVVVMRLDHPEDTALTLGRAVAGSAARVKARSIGREERKADRDADTPTLRPDHVTAAVFLLGKNIRLLPNADGELRAADGDQPADQEAVRRYLTKAFGDQLDAVRQAMEELAARYEPAELNRIGFRLYEMIYCARGEMENRIKECQLDLFAGRTSAASMRANQLRLWLASMAYVLLSALRRIGLPFTQFARATCGTIRLKLLKIGALVRLSVRRVVIAMASACPFQHEFALAHALLRRAMA
jgi:hypothetical protein